MTNVLVTIPFSHFCEKARWALDFGGIPFVERGHLPLLAYLATTPRRGRSVPVLVTPGEVLRDSTEIVAWVDAHADRRKDRALYPADVAMRAEALAIEDLCDERLGPHVRRFGYVQLFSDRALTDELLALAPVPAWELRAVKLARPLVIGAMTRALKLTPEGARRSEGYVREVFAEIGRHLATREWLSGDRFGVADLTFAALAQPMLLPPEYPLVSPPVERISPAWAALRAELSDTPAGEHALRCYRDHRA